jgi:radical SAM superfamily enzyme YgiQ (UPF0313 family)
MIFLPDADEWCYMPQPHRQNYPPAVLDQVCAMCADVDLVGIGVMSNFFGRARALTEMIHDRLSLPVIWGGIHPTVKPDECLAWADFVCVGEGEEATVELVNRLAAGLDCTSIPNIWVKDEAGQIIANPVRPLDQSLDDLPLADYELSKQSILHRDRLVPLTPALLAHYLINYFAGEPRVAYMTIMTRGCPYECTYCCASALAQIYPNWRRIRRRSPDHVIAEINAARQLVPALETIMFLDDTFLAMSTDELGRFGEMYREEVGLPFFILVTPRSVTEEKLQHLVQAGLQDVEMGIQTGSRSEQTLFRRPEDNRQILMGAQRLRQFQRWIPRPRYDVISDNPYATRADRLETLRLLFRLPRPSQFYLFSLTFYPGTELYKRAKADGLIHDDEQEVYRKNYNQLEPTYYNFVLWCFHRNLPRWLLWLLIKPLSLRLFESPALRWLFRLLWNVITFLRTRRGRRIYLQHAARLALDEE